MYRSIFDHVASAGRRPRAIIATSFATAGFTDRQLRRAAYAYALGRALPALVTGYDLPGESGEIDSDAPAPTRGDRLAARGEIPIHAFPAGDPTSAIAAPAPTIIVLFDVATVRRARRARRARGVPRRFYRVRNKFRVGPTTRAPAGFPRQGTTGSPRGFARYVRDYAVA